MKLNHVFDDLQLNLNDVLLLVDASTKLLMDIHEDIYELEIHMDRLGMEMAGIEHPHQNLLHKMEIAQYDYSRANKRYNEQLELVQWYEKLALNILFSTIREYVRHIEKNINP